MTRDKQVEVANALYTDSLKHAAPDAAETGSSPPWEPPVPLVTASVPEFPADALPPWLADFVTAEAVATQTPPDLAGMLVLAVVATACAKRIEIKLRDGHLEPVNLFTVVALPPGNRKSAVFKDVAAPLEEFEADELRRIGPIIAELQSRRRIAEDGLKRLEAHAANAKPEDREAATAAAADLARELVQSRVPAAPRWLVDDCSAERLATLVRDHGGRMAVLAPEGDLFDLMRGRYSSGTPNFEVYLRGHAGDNLRVDRVNRPSEFVQAVAITIGLAVQPEVLSGVMATPGFRGRGLLGRFLYSLPESLLGRRDADSLPVPLAVSAAYWREIHRLLTLPVDTDPESGIPIRRILTLDAEAALRFREFERQVEPWLGEFGVLGHMADWGGKLAGAVARLAALFHAADPASGHAPWSSPVPLRTLDNAIRIGEYLVPHAVAAYGTMGGDPEIENAHHLLGWIRRNGVEEFSKREAFIGTRGRFKRVASMEPALALLREHCFIRLVAQEEVSRPGRRRSAIYEVNPSLSARLSQIAQNRSPDGSSVHSAHSADGGTAPGATHEA